MQTLLTFLHWFPVVVTVAIFGLAWIADTDTDDHEAMAGGY